MNIFLSPQVSDKRIEYTFDGEIITATMGEQFDTFDLTVFPEDGEFDGIETTLPIVPILSVTRKDGELSVILLNPITSNATESERFPEWTVV